MKEKLIILDFDNTLYFNPFNDFSTDFEEDNVVSLSSFFNAFYLQHHIAFSANVPLVLITGRDYSQKEAILSLLEKKGFQFEMTYFYSFENFWNYGFQGYYKFKFNIIFKLLPFYKEIWVFDDDPNICLPLALIPACFHVFRVRLFGDKVKWMAFHEITNDALKKEDLENINAFLHHY